MELLISIVVIILFMAKWGIERTRTKALMYFIVDRGYTPRTGNDGVYQDSDTENSRKMD